MLINYVPGEECRIAIARDGRLEEFYQERASTESHVGNIYKGRVTNVESSIQAAFIDFGLEQNGFLHVSDLHPMHFPGKDREEFERVGSKTPHRRRPPIQQCLKKGQEVLVQVLKEGIGTKGPTLTSYLSIPGRFLVMMPNMQRLGVSRRSEDDDSRQATRKLLAELDPPEGFGFIVRTAGIGQTKTDLKRDLAYLQRLWKNIERRRKSIGRVGELYTESDLIIRTIRDIFSNDIDRVVVDDSTAARRAHDFLSIASPRAQSKVVYYNDPVPLFHRFGIEEQIARIHDREAPLPSGGSLVIDATEALVAIDVNSGKSRQARDAESNAFNTNKEAVDEIARQLRLRDLGGVIVNDLIDMRDPKHRKQIESRMRQALKDDRARSRIGSISQFGLLEMTRQRMRPSLRTSNYNNCATCEGFGYVKSAESVVLDVMRRLRLVMQHEKIERVELTISPDVAFQLLNRKRGELVRLERVHRKPVMVRVGGHRVDYVDIAGYDSRGLVDLETLSRPDALPAERESAYVELERGELPAEVLAEIEQAEREQAELLEQAEPAEAVEAAEAVPGVEAESEEPRPRKRRRRRGGRSRRKKQTQDTSESQHADESSAPAAPEDDAATAETGSEGEPPGQAEGQAEGPVEGEAADEGQNESRDESRGPGAGKKKRSAKQGASRKKRSRKKRSTKTSKATAEADGPPGEPTADDAHDAGAAEPAEPAESAESASDAKPASGDGDGEAASGRKRRRRGRSRRRGSASTSTNGDQADGEARSEASTSGYANRMVDTPDNESETS